MPVICVVIGEGSSGGALGIGVGDHLAMLQYATYFVISPEGCASILWKSADKAQLAAEAMAKGAFDFIAKPFKPKELRAVINKAALSLGHQGIA